MSVVQKPRGRIGRWVDWFNEFSKALYYQSHPMIHTYDENCPHGPNCCYCAFYREYLGMNKPKEEPEHATNIIPFK